MKKILTPNINATKGNMTPLFFLDIILDTDFGLISHIGAELLDPHVFDKSKFDGLTVKELTSILYYRPAKNPLLYFLNENKRNEADEYYRDIMSDDECYAAILDRSTMTEIFHLIRVFCGESDIRSTVLVKNEIERSIWSQITPNKKKIKVITPQELNQSEIDGYFQIYAKYPEDIQYLSKDLNLRVIDKTIYLASYHFNFFTSAESTYVDQPIIQAISFRNIINTIDIYKRNLLRERKEG